MLLAELREGVDPKAFVRAPAYGEMLRDSLQWDAVLPYTTREVGESFILQDVSDINEESRMQSAA
jgi:hypothetical protein